MIVPNWNKAELLERTLETLGKQSLAPERTLVVDNGSTDGSRAAAGRRGAQVVELGANQGFARAVNTGVRLAETEWVAVVNNDVELHPRWLETLRRRAEEAGAWFAAPRLVQMRTPARLDGSYDLLARSGCAWRAGQGAVNGAPYLEERVIAFAPFTALVLKKALFERAGGLEERFGSYLEDIEFCLRCALQGLSGIYVPQAVAYHHGNATLGRWSAAMVELMARNQVLLAAKHFPASYFWRVAAGQGLWGVVAARHGRLGAWVKGKVSGLRQFRAVRKTARRAGREALDAVLLECEEEIRRLQGATRREAYWRMYFAVAR